MLVWPLFLFLFSFFANNPLLLVHSNRAPTKQSPLLLVKHPGYVAPSKKKTWTIRSSTKVSIWSTKTNSWQVVYEQDDPVQTIEVPALEHKNTN